MKNKERSVIKEVLIYISLIPIVYLVLAYPGMLSLLWNVLSALWILPITAWLSMCFLVSKTAKKRDCKHSFWVALILSPLVGFLYVIASPTKAEIGILKLLEELKNEE